MHRISLVNKFYYVLEPVSAPWLLSACTARFDSERYFYSIICIVLNIVIRKYCDIIVRSCRPARDKRPFCPEQFSIVLSVSHQYVMELTFAQAAKGVNKEITVNIEATCKRCDGKGHEPGSKIQHCHHCNGTGMVSSAVDFSSLSYKQQARKVSLVL